MNECTSTSLSIQIRCSFQENANIKICVSSYTWVSNLHKVPDIHMFAPIKSKTLKGTYLATIQKFFNAIVTNFHRVQRDRAVTYICIQIISEVLRTLLPQTHIPISNISTML